MVLAVALKLLLELTVTPGQVIAYARTAGGH
jgi:hypothetical protein